MRNKKKAIFNTIFLILIFSITVYMVFKGEDLGEIIHTVRQADPVYLLSAWFVWYCSYLASL